MKPDSKQRLAAPNLDFYVSDWSTKELSKMHLNVFGQADSKNSTLN
jgi:hypothetical protein